MELLYRCVCLSDTIMNNDNDRNFANQLNISTALHAYACDCITHHLFHPHGTDCITNKDDEEMMHQVAADDSLQSKSTSQSLKSQSSY